MTSWKTSLGGIILALGGIFTQQTDHTLQLIGAVLSAVGALLLGLAAKDSNVHGGTVAQATPPAVQEQMKAEGMQMVKDQIASGK